jgi:hypothetical protein
MSEKCNEEIKGDGDGDGEVTVGVDGIEGNHTNSSENFEGNTEKCVSVSLLHDNGVIHEEGKKEKEREENERMKTKYDEWVCGGCTFCNRKFFVRCEICNTKNPQYVVPNPSLSSPQSPSSPLHPNHPRPVGSVGGVGGVGKRKAEKDISKFFSPTKIKK